MIASIARLRHRLTLETPVRLGDGAGGANEAWVAIGDIWAAIRAISGGKSYAAHRISGRVTHEIWLRPRSDLAPNQRFRRASRTFLIHAVLRGEEPARRIRCLCEERDL